MLITKAICIPNERGAFEDELAGYVLTDTILYVPETPAVKKKYGTRLAEALQKVNDILGTSYKATGTLDVGQITFRQEKRLRIYLENASDDKFKVLHLAALNLRSVLLGVLFAEKQIAADEAFELAFFEEICQQQEWGTDDEIAMRHRDIRKILSDLEKMRDEGSLSEN